MALVPSTSVGGGAVGAPVLLFDSTLSGAANIIDTGALGVSTAYTVLEAFFLGRTDEAGASIQLVVRVNGDSSAIYDAQWSLGVNALPSANAVVAGTSWAPWSHGNGGTASYASAFSLIIPGYASTTFFKTGALTLGAPDGLAANNLAGSFGLGYRSTTAISRLSVAAAGAANLQIGSRLMIYGR